MEGFVAQSECEKWNDEKGLGFLLVFEGLLSVVNKERSMLEDTISVVNALKSFQVRIFSSEDAQSIEIKMKGREILLFIPDLGMKKLPVSYQIKSRSGGVVIKFFPVLFTQVIFC
jgi:hypothetical protein